jgi:hypothetical protein
VNRRVLRIFLIVISTLFSQNSGANFKLDTTQNANGYFNIDTRVGRYILALIMQIRVIMLEYVSDGLEYIEEIDIKIVKRPKLLCTL